MLTAFCVALQIFFLTENMPASLGEKLRKAREEQGISISEVAEETRISAIHLKSIEKDDYQSLPGGIFNKGFIKSFAKYVDVDEQEAIRDYNRLTAKHEGVEKTTSLKPYQPKVITDDNSSMPILLTIAFVIIILVSGAWGVIRLLNYLPSKEEGSKESESAIVNNNMQSSNNDTNSTAVADEIKIEIQTTAETLSIKAKIDGEDKNTTITPRLSWTIRAENSAKISYYKGLAGSVQLTINGKKIETPLPPPSYERNSLQYEVNIKNLNQILQDGKINIGTPDTANTKDFKSMLKQKAF